MLLRKIEQTRNENRIELIQVNMAVLFVWMALGLAVVILIISNQEARQSICSGAYAPVRLCSLHVMSWSEIALERMSSITSAAIVHIGLTIFFWRKAKLFLGLRIKLITMLCVLLFVIPVKMVGDALLMLLWKGEPLSAFHERFVWIFVDYPAYAFLIGVVVFFQLQFITFLRSAKESRNLVRMQQERIELRLHLLHGQLKPHFLFNALNSVGALIRDGQRQLAGTALIQLNALLRYVVHASKTEWTDIEGEIQFLRDYLDMQRLRFGERMCVEWEIEDCQWQNVQCATLIFQPLVENAIHHGVEPHHGESLIKIGFGQSDRAVFFTISNTKMPGAFVRRGYGMGLSSTKERIELIYGTQAHITTTNTPEMFMVQINFPLTLITVDTFEFQPLPRLPDS